MNGDVQTKELDKRFVVTEPEQMRKVPRVVLCRVDRREFTFSVNVSIDAAGNGGEFRDAVRHKFRTRAT